jgi:DNA topoisomerase-1
MDVEFTAQMESELDKVEEGDLPWAEAIGEFYSPFERDLKRAEKEMPGLKGGVEVDEHCPECGKQLLKRWGSSGMFLGCAGYPDCRYTKNLSPGGWRMEEEPTDEVCPKCAKPMVIKHGRFGRFIACTGYPECRTTKPITMGIKCPEPGCAGEIVQRRSRRGKVFYGCSAYPDCKFVVWNRPIAEPCPQCQAPFVVERTARGGRFWRACARPPCDYKSEVETRTEVENTVA